MNRDTETRNQIILAALLHDIGKFMQRAQIPFESGYDPNGDKAHVICPKNSSGFCTHHHALYTAQFFDTLAQPQSAGQDASEIISRAGDWACMHHHARDEAPEQVIIQVADRLSSGVDRQDRDEESEDSQHERGDFRKIRLRSIFSEIALEPHKASPSQWRYHGVSWLDPQEGAFPNQTSEKDTALPAEYEKLWRRFLDEYKKIPWHNLPAFLNALDALLLQSAWCIPSSTLDQPNVSLYDHSRTTAAIAASLWDYHTAPGGNLSAASIRDKTAAKFLLIGGDLSGIQAFIFNLDHSNTRGTAKILRARSFYLAALTLAIIRLIERETGISSFSTIMNAGGRFSLLVANLPDVREGLERVCRHVNAWLMTQFCAELSLNLNWETSLTGADFSEERFGDKIDEMRHRLELEKRNKWRDLMRENGYWKECPDTLAPDYDRYSDSLCAIAGYGAATEEHEGRKISTQTKREIILGRRLTSAQALILGISVNDPDVEFFGSGNDAIGLKVLDHPAAMAGPNETVWSINKYTPGLGLLYIANHVPKLTQEECDYYARTTKAEEAEGEDEERSDDILKQGNAKTFEHIARPLRLLNKDGKFTGAEMLGLLKADVDNLGLIASQGLGKRSLSRYVTFSRMLNFFFAARVPALMEIKHTPPSGASPPSPVTRDFSNIYTVFAGGDDLFLVSDWQSALAFAETMQSEFGRFTGANPDITISAAVSLLKPRQPIRHGARLADEDLDLAKCSGRNALRFFKTTASWQDALMLREFAEFLNEGLRSKKLSSAFLYRLLHYHGLYQRFHDEGDMRAGTYLSKIHYDIARNIDKREIKNGRRIGDPSPELLQISRLLSKEEKDQRLMKNLKAPVSWALYQNRGGKA